MKLNLFRKQKSLKFLCMSEKEDNFYMCFVDGERTPTVKHILPIQADVEAKRLSEKFGKKVYVLKAIRAFEVKTIELNPEDNLPF